MLTKDTVTNVVEFVQVTGELLDQYQQKVASLEKEIATAKQVHKEASAKPSAPVLGSEQVARTVESMAKAGFIKKAEREQAMNQISADPAVLLSYIDKLAEREITSVKPMARVVQSQSPVVSGRESDRVFEQTFRNLRSRI